MRDIILLLISLAGAIILAGLQARYPSNTTIWKWSLPVGAALFSGFSLWLLIETCRPGSDRLLAFGMAASPKEERGRKRGGPGIFKVVGMWLSLVERSFRVGEVGSSNLPIPTKLATLF